MQPQHARPDHHARQRPASTSALAARRIPLALHQLSDDALRHVVGVFTDVDGTLTTRGKLPAQAYTALERLHRAGVKVVPVTGRSIAWCEVIARLWPVDAVIGENGAFAMRVDALGHLASDFVDDAQTRLRNLERIREIGAEILRAVPGTALATDQAWHAADLAIDHAEQVPRCRRWPSGTSSTSCARTACMRRSARSTSTAGSAGTTS